MQTTRSTPLAAAAAAAADDDDDLYPVQLPAAGPLRQLFETASARRRRHVYAEARKRGMDRLAWPRLVAPSARVDDRHLPDGVTPAHPTPEEVGSSDYDV